MRKDIKIGLVAGIVIIIALAIFISGKMPTTKRPHRQNRRGTSQMESLIEKSRQQEADIKKQPYSPPRIPENSGNRETPVEQIQPENDSKDTRPPQKPVQQEPKFQIYIVQQGDTLSGISRKFYGSSAEYLKIQLANNLDDPGKIKPGMELKIPIKTD